MPIRYFRCRCQTEWQAGTGHKCPRCGRFNYEPAFTKEDIAPGIVDEHIEGGGTVRMVRPEKLVDGVYGDIFVGPMDGDDWEGWLARMGL